MHPETLTATSQYAALLRQELSARNTSYAMLHELPHVTSYGQPPVVVYQLSDSGRTHGNFISASYQAMLRKPEWRRRLQKVHSEGNHALPKADCIWRELDSSMSSRCLADEHLLLSRCDEEKRAQSAVGD